eukprot:517366_1
MSKPAAFHQIYGRHHFSNTKTFMFVSFSPHCVKSYSQSKYYKCFKSRKKEAEKSSLQSLNKHQYKKLYNASKASIDSSKSLTGLLRKKRIKNYRKTKLQNNNRIYQDINDALIDQQYESCSEFSVASIDSKKQNKMHIRNTSYKSKKRFGIGASTIDIKSAGLEYLVHGYMRRTHRLTCNDIIDIIHMYCGTLPEYSMKFKIPDSWTEEYSNDDQCNYKFDSKLLKWNDKIYLILAQTDSYVKPNTISDKITELIIPNPSQVYETSDMSTNTMALFANKDKAMIYILSNPYRPGNFARISTHTIYVNAYDLTSQQIKQQFSLNINDVNPSNSQSHLFIREMYGVCNKSSDESITKWVTDVINHWFRFTNELEMPQDIHVVIYQFYSFLTHSNLLHLLVNREGSKTDPTDEEFKIYKHTISHVLIDLDQMKLDITDEFIIEKTRRRMGQRRNSSYLRLRVDNDIYWIFDHWTGTFKVNLENGLIQKEIKHMNPYPNDTNIINTGWHGDFDEVITDEYEALNGDQRYLPILTKDERNQPDFDLVCFDRNTTRFTMIKENMTVSRDAMFSAHSTPMMYSQKGYKDMLICKNHLYFLRCTDSRKTVVEGVKFEYM